jgi:hypothetical protein
MRDGFEAAARAGTNFAFTGANDGYWQIRYEQERRTIVEYRLAGIDPETDPAHKTTWFRKLDPPRPECQLLGVSWLSGIEGDHDFTVPAAAASDPWLAGTGLAAGSVVKGVVGAEWNTVDPACSEAPNVLFHFDGGSAPGGAVSADAVKRTDPSSGARIFSAGSLRFSWGLDSNQGPLAENGNREDPRLEQFMRNALDDLTRPAAPLTVSARPARRHRVAVRASWRGGDPRVTGVVVYRHAGTADFAPGQPGVRRVCTAPANVCFDRRPLLGVSRYGVAVTDRWGRSAMLLAAPLALG